MEEGRVEGEEGLDTLLEMFPDCRAQEGALRALLEHSGSVGHAVDRIVENNCRIPYVFTSGILRCRADASPEPAELQEQPITLGESDDDAYGLVSRSIQRAGSNDEEVRVGGGATSPHAATPGPSGTQFSPDSPWSEDGTKAKEEEADADMDGGDDDVLLNTEPLASRLLRRLGGTVDDRDPRPHSPVHHASADDEDVAEVLPAARKRKNAPVDNTVGSTRRELELQEQRQERERKKADEKAKRDAAADARKSTAGHYQKEYTTVCLDPRLLESPMVERVGLKIQSLVIENKYKQEVREGREGHMRVTWKHRGMDRTCVLALVIPGAEYLRLVADKKATDLGKEVREQYPAHLITLVVDGLREELRKGQSHYDERHITYIDTLMQTRFHINTVYASSPAEVASFIQSTSKVIAAYPYEASLDDQISHCETVGNTKKGSVNWQIADRLGSNPSIAQKAWAKMLTSIPGITLSRAFCIMQEYPTCGSLIKQYTDPGRSERDKRLLLENILLDPTADATGAAKRRRLGPSASEKVYRLFTCDNAQVSMK